MEIAFSQTATVLTILVKSYMGAVRNSRTVLYIRTGIWTDAVGRHTAHRHRRSSQLQLQQQLAWMRPFPGNRVRPGDAVIAASGRRRPRAE